MTPDLQDLVRKAPDALLGRRILVCEGKTELGLCRGLESSWAEERDDVPLAHTGTILTHGGGTEAPSMALRLAMLRYEVALLMDSDQPINPAVNAELVKAGVEVVAWGGKVSTDERVALDLPWAALQDVVDLAVSLRDQQSVRGSVMAHLPPDTTIKDVEIDSWKTAGVSESQIREAIGKAAKRKAWFKRIDLGEELGRIVGRALPSIRKSDLALKLGKVADWAYAD